MNSFWAVKAKLSFCFVCRIFCFGRVCICCLLYSLCERNDLFFFSYIWVEVYIISFLLLLNIFFYLFVVVEDNMLESDHHFLYALPYLYVSFFGLTCSSLNTHSAMAAVYNRKSPLFSCDHFCIQNSRIDIHYITRRTVIIYIILCYFFLLVPEHQHVYVFM